MLLLLDTFWKVNYALSIILICFGLAIRVPHRSHWFLRTICSSLFPVSLSALLISNWEWTGDLISADNILRNWPIRIFVCGLIMLHLLFSYFLCFWDALLLLTFALYLQGIQFCFFMIIDQALYTALNRDYSEVLRVAICMVTVLLFLFISIRFYNQRSEFIYNSAKNHKMIVGLLLYRAVDNLYNQYLFATDPYANVGFTMATMRMSNIVRTALVLLLVHNLLLRKNLLAEKQIMENLAVQRSQQYDYLKSLMQSINIKSHDLKKQISYLRNHTAEKEVLFNQLEETIEEYDSIIHTRNDTLSLVLTEKSLLFRQRHIPFSCVPGSSDLGFMSGLDIYTLFANLLDNALEACQNVDQSHQSVMLIIKEKKHFLSIHQENYFDGKLILQDGIPVTTKQDSLYHGFGTKSITEIVNRYGGTVQYTSRGNIFCVNILFPM